MSKNTDDFSLPLSETARGQQENSRNSSSSLDQSGDTSWSTAPNTPTTTQKVITAEPQASTNSASIVLNSDSLWEWNTGREEVIVTEPKPERSTKKPSKEMTDKAHHGGKNLPSGVEIVRPSDGNVKVGFFDASPPNATDPTELPGTRPAVTTQPPGSDQRPRAHSIENNSSGNYSPTNADSCLQLGSYLASPMLEDKLSPDSGKGSSVAKQARKASIAESVESIQGSSADLNSLEDKGISEDAYAELTKSGLCYDFIPLSTKIVVFDTRLRVKKAFFALVANGIRAAPLWDSAQQKFVGMLTITDFINILRHHYRSPIVGMDELENQTIQEWLNFEKKVVSFKAELIQIGPEQSLYEGIKMLVEHKIHRLPVIDPLTGNSMYIFTHKRILEILMQKIPEESQPQYMFKSLEELGLGTYKDIATASQDTPIIVALNVFHEKRVSALPIVDKENRVVDIYTKFDVINLAAERTYNNLDVNLRDALQHRSTGFEGVITCYLWESLYTIVQRLIDTKVHRLVVVDSDRHVLGVVSLSDILKFLVMKPHS